MPKLDNRMVDLMLAQSVEIKVSDAGSLWVNVEGVCKLRIRRVSHLTVEDSRTLNAGKEEND